MSGVPHSVVYIKLFLNAEQWAFLVEWVGRPVGHTKRGDGGGMQQRRRDWAKRMDPIERSILLTTASSSVRKTKDDMTWIANTIVNQYAGGFQGRVARIFQNAHSSFTDLPIKPRKRSQEEKLRQLTALRRLSLPGVMH